MSSTNSAIPLDTASTTTPVSGITAYPGRMNSTSYPGKHIKEGTLFMALNRNYSLYIINHADRIFQRFTLVIKIHQRPLTHEIWMISAIEVELCRFERWVNEIQYSSGHRKWRPTLLSVSRVWTLLYIAIITWTRHRYNKRKRISCKTVLQLNQICTAYAPRNHIYCTTRCRVWWYSSGILR